MAQRPLKRVRVAAKPTKYRKSSRKFKDEESLIRKDINRKTIEMLEREHRKR